MDPLESTLLITLRLKVFTTERDAARDLLELLRLEKSSLDTDYVTMQSKLEEVQKSAREKIVLLEQAKEHLGLNALNLAKALKGDSTSK